MGMVGGAQVTFTGKISGGKASGEWKTANGIDSGKWSGKKVSNDKKLPCMAGGQEAQQEEHQVQEGLCTPNPPRTFLTGYQAAWKALVDTFGEDSLRCYHQATQMGIAYTASFELVGYQESKAQEYLASLQSSLEAQGAQVMQSTVGDDMIGVMAMVTPTPPAQSQYPMLMVMIEIDNS